VIVKVVLRVNSAELAFFARVTAYCDHGPRKRVFW